MKTLKQTLLRMAVTIGCMGLIVSVTQAAGLNTLIHGFASDPDALNYNFTYLNDRIDTHSLTPGPAGPQGPAGADGTDGADGTGVVFHSWAGFGGARKWHSKAFNVTHSSGSFDKEVRTFVVTPTGPGKGTLAMTRQRTLAATVVKHHVLHSSFDVFGGHVLTGKDTYRNDATTLKNTQAIDPGIVMRHDAMGVGMTWASAVTITRIDVLGGGAGNLVYFGTDSRSLLGVEDIAVNGVGYVGCQKILSNHYGQYLGNFNQTVTWYCPADGVVKRIVTKTTGESYMLEFDPADASSLPN